MTLLQQFGGSPLAQMSGLIGFILGAFVVGGIIYFLQRRNYTFQIEALKESTEITHQDYIVKERDQKALQLAVQIRQILKAAGELNNVPVLIEGIASHATSILGLNQYVFTVRRPQDESERFAGDADRRVLTVTVDFSKELPEHIVFKYELSDKIVTSPARRESDYSKQLAEARDFVFHRRWHNVHLQSAS